MHDNEIKVRKLPKKTISWIVITIVVGIIGFILISNGKAAKVKRILAEVGYKNVANIIVFGEHEFLNKDTKVKGKQYSIEFTNLDSGKKCRGFVFRDFKRKHMKDLECK